jgi:hypothetical protein
MSVKLKILDAVLTIDDSLHVAAEDTDLAAFAQAIELGANELQGFTSEADQAKHVAKRLIERHGGEILSETEPLWMNDPIERIY